MGTTKPTQPSPRPKATPAHDTYETRTPHDILVSRYPNIPEDPTPPIGKQTRIVEILWIDAIALGGDNWVDETDIQPHGAPSIAIGYIINETDHTITIASLVNKTHYSHGITIPRGCITHINELT